MHSNYRTDSIRSLFKLDLEKVKKMHTDVHGDDTSINIIEI